MTLLGFMPLLEIYRDKDVAKWRGGGSDKEGVLTVPYPEYPPEIEEFFREVSQPWWCDYDYDTRDAQKLIEEKIDTADIDQIKTMLTYVARGERFCDGFWIRVLRSGKLIQIFRRLLDLWFKRFDFRSNLLIDQDNPILIQKAWRDHFAGESYWKEDKDGGKAYLGVLHGEDALTWNVFRSLQKEGPRGYQIISDFFSLSIVKTLLFWGCDVENQGEEQQRLNILIRVIDGQLKGTMTEPDLVVITEREVAFIECKLNISGGQSPWKAQSGSQDKQSGAFRRRKVYIEKAGLKELEGIEEWTKIYQILRQYMYAKCLAMGFGKRPVIIPLINEVDQDTLISFYAKVLNGQKNKSRVFREMATWQDLQTRIARSDLGSKEKILSKMHEALTASDRQCRPKMEQD